VVENTIEFVPLSRIDDGGRVGVHDGAEVKEN
jgi:hypothetical protein